MPAFLIPWLFRLGALIAVGLFLYGLWYRVDHWCNSACLAKTADADRLQLAVDEAHERATALALLWAKAIETVHVEYREKVVYRERKVEVIREVAGKIKSETDAIPVPVPGAARRVLSDAERVANDPAAAPGDSQSSEAVPEAADSTLTDWIAFSIAAAEAYADAREKHMACVAWASSITQSQSASAE